MDDGRTIGTRDLVIAIFRLAVADYLGIWYGHDEPAPYRHNRARFQLDADEFLRSRLAANLADSVGLSTDALWIEIRRLQGLEKSQPSAA